MNLNNNELIIKVDYSSFCSLKSFLKILSLSNITYKKLGNDEYLIMF